MIGFIVNHIQTLFWTAFYHTVGRMAFAQLGRGSKFQGWIDIPQRGGQIRIGRNVCICRSVEFSVIKNAELIISDGVFLGRGTVISVHRQVSVGGNALVAEYVSIHDNNRQTRDDQLLVCRQGFKAEALSIGEDCWIGAKAVLVKGSGLGRRCVLGAGAVLTKKLPDNTVAAGVPARPLGEAVCQNEAA
jgi:acetyltransferase-like isoleucine patch superfamily enzyme